MANVPHNAMRCAPQHMGMFSIATLYIMLVVALMSNAKITASRWYRWEKNIEYFPNESLEAALKRTVRARPTSPIELPAVGQRGGHGPR